MTWLGAHKVGGQFNFDAYGRLARKNLLNWGIYRPLALFGKGPNNAS